MDRMVVNCWVIVKLRSKMTSFFFFHFFFICSFIFYGTRDRVCPIAFSFFETFCPSFPLSTATLLLFPQPSPGSGLCWASLRHRLCSRQPTELPVPMQSCLFPEAASTGYQQVPLGSRATGRESCGSPRRGRQQEPVLALLCHTLNYRRDLTRKLFQCNVEYILNLLSFLWHCPEFWGGCYSYFSNVSDFGVSAWWLWVGLNKQWQQKTNILKFKYFMLMYCSLLNPFH